MALSTYLISNTAKTLIAQAARFITAMTVAEDYVVTRFSVDYQAKNWRISDFANNLFDEQALTVNEPTTTVMWRVTTEKWK
ncbi:hypothetical protein AYJ58_19340 [Shewanella sp. Pdp11]|nr:hypothetical protein AYJ58_19340 [Shewanella sp. Pdp11]